MSELPFHPLADIFPLLEGDELMELAADIFKNGLREPIVMYEGAILDGRNRYRACLNVCHKPELEDFNGPDPLGFVLSKNLVRRHLNDSQRALVAARIATLKKGQRKSDSPNGGSSQADAARRLNVKKRSVERGRQVLDNGSPELISAVEKGDVKVSAAAKSVNPITKKLADKYTVPQDAKLGPIEAHEATIEQPRVEKKIKRIYMRPDGFFDEHEITLAERIKELEAEVRQLKAAARFADRELRRSLAECEKLHGANSQMKPCSARRLQDTLMSKRPGLDPWRHRRRSAKCWRPICDVIGRHYRSGFVIIAATICRRSRTRLRQRCRR